MCCRKQRLTRRLFDLAANGGVGIVAAGAGKFAERAEVSCTAPAAFKDQAKHPGSSRGEEVAGPSNG